MKKFAAVLAIAMALASGIADARGGGSSGGHGGGGGHASSGGSRGGFSSAGGGSRPSAPVAAPAPSRPSGAPAAPATRSTTTTTTTTTRTAGGGYVGGPVMYGGFGMGYGYSNGLLTGMIIGNMMHPHNTVVYTGGGVYNNNALLYPDGRVVNQQGYQVGVYQNGVFTPVTNGAMVAQAAPADALNHAPAQPVVIQKAGLSVGEVIGIVFLVLGCLFLFIILIGMI